MFGSTWSKLRKKVKVLFSYQIYRLVKKIHSTQSLTQNVIIISSRNQFEPTQHSHDQEEQFSLRPIGVGRDDVGFDDERLVPEDVHRLGPLVIAPEHLGLVAEFIRRSFAAKEEEKEAHPIKVIILCYINFIKVNSAHTR